MFRKCIAVVIGLCTAISFGFAQQQVIKNLKRIPKKPILVRSAFRPPLVRAEQLVSSTNLFEQALLSGLEEAARQQTMGGKLYAHPLVLPGSVVRQQDHFFIDYLLKHQWQWPTLTAGPQAREALAYVRRTLAISNPTAQELEAQRGMIRYRAAQKDMKQLVPAVQDYLRQRGTFPAYDHPELLDKATPQEIRLWEDFSFALAASKVPMQNNPFAQLEGLAQLEERYHVFNALRRASDTSAGIAVFAPDGSVQIPAWTLDEFKQNQLRWVQNHPFEYALAPYRAAYFGDRIPEVFGVLSHREKQALLFTTPGLPVVEKENLPTYYKEETARWVRQTGRPLSSYCTEEDSFAYWTLFDRQPSKQLFFQETPGVTIPFLSLSYDKQIEELMWTWNNLDIDPIQALPYLTGME